MDNQPVANQPSEGKVKVQTAESASLGDTELENITGGMQNQLNTNSVNEHPGGANKKLNSKLAQGAIPCNALGKEGL